ncbi:MAG: hypothetical protein AB7G11_06225 [Phycisphaerales bacterium]
MNLRAILRFLLVAVVAATSMLAVSNAFADKLHLKNGKVLDGSVVAEGKGWVQFKYSIANIEQTQIFTDAEYSKLEKDSVTNPAPAPDAGKTDSAVVTPKKPGVTRIAILNFGPPSQWSEQCGDMVGVQISAEAYRKAIPMLKKEQVDVVVIRVNSGGGYLLEIEKFHDLFHNEYKKNFRTVAWFESGISAAAMSPWVINEFYFMDKGSLGACTGWYGPLIAVKGEELEAVLIQMEKASILGGRDPKIMRAMQIMEPLSVTKDPKTGEITWFQNLSGDKVINGENRILTLNSHDAYEYGISRGTANTPEELGRVMLGPNAEFEIGAKDVSDFVDNFMREQDRAEKQAVEVVIKYITAIRLAQAVQDRQERGAQVNIAKRQLAQLRKWVKMNPNMEFHLGGYVGARMTDEWFHVQEQFLRDLLK